MAETTIQSQVKRYNLQVYNNEVTAFVLELVFEFFQSA